jgi:choice-of-anchor B domain-containing protein
MLAAIIAITQLGGAPTPEPPASSHCACDRGVCPIDANGRACSCGCGQRADRQAVQDLPPLFDARCVDGMAGPYPCKDVDLLAFLPHAEIGGGSGNDVWGWTDPQTGREYAIVGRSTGTAFVDVSNPRQPVYLGDLATHTTESIWRGIKVFANHAFIVSEAANHGMQIFDLRQLRRVASPPVAFVETAHYSGFGSTHTLAMNTHTGFAYAVGTRTCEGGLHVVDVREPTAPKTAGCFSLDGYTHEAQCTIYAGSDVTYRGHEICFNSNEDTLTIVDVTDKHEQVQLSRTGYSGSAYTHQGWLTENQRFFLVDDESDERAFHHPTRTWMWDVSDLDAPVLIGYHDAEVNAIDHNLYIRGHLAYEANYRSGLHVLDLSNVADSALGEVGFFDIYPADDEPAFNGAWSVYPFFSSGSVAINGIEQGLFVLRPRVQPRGQPTGFSLTIAEPGDPAPSDQDWSYVVTASNDGPDALKETRVIETPPTNARLLAARGSQGKCTMTTVATCDIGDLAPGSEAHVVVTVRPNGEGSFVATATASARTSNRALVQASAIATTRGVRYQPNLTLRRPSSGILFRIGRNNTVQWTLRGVAGRVKIELSRDAGATWATLSDAAPNLGFFDWAATGELSPAARIRLTSVTRPNLTQTSPSFVITP